MNPTVYVHDLDPVIWQITDSIALRWYGLAYLTGFIGGYYLPGFPAGSCILSPRTGWRILLLMWLFLAF